MHDLTDSSDVDSNLYPALLQVFTIILLGYMAGTLKIVTKEQSLGLNIFVGTFILPALLLKNIATLDFSKVEWLFLGSIAASKALIFFVAMILTIITIRPLNLGLAAVFAIFVSQSNDFALGVPIVDAVYSKSHPNYIKYIYLIAPISLCFLNPIAFFFMELNEHWENNKALERKQREEVVEECEATGSKITPQKSDTQAMTSSGRSSSLEELQGFNEYFFEDDVVISRKKVELPRKLSKAKLIKQTLWQTAKNPIVFMTFIGFLVNITFDRKIPSLIEPIITTLANSFSALALFYLGLTMVGKIRNLTFGMIIMIIILIFSKGLIFPLVTREMVYLFQNLNGTSSGKGASVQTNDDLSTFGFLYGTFPSAPSLLIFIGKYKSIQQDLISSALVFGTLASAPLMMVSGKMISIEYFNHSSKNFDDIQCKTAYGFSFATWFCGIWVLYIFLASGRILHRPHRYTFFLICAQMLNSLIHIIWTTTTNPSAESDVRSSYTYVFFSLFAAFLTRCIPLTIILNLISISKIERYNQIPFNRIIFKLAGSNFFLALVGFILPLVAAALCLTVGGVPVNQGMMVTVGKRQVIISVCLLVFVILSMAYCLILFARTKFDEHSMLSIVASKKTQYFSTSSPTPSQFSGISSEVEGSTTSLLNEEVERERSSENRNTLAYINRMNARYQIMQHISLVLVLLFVTLMCLFFQIWVLKMEYMSGIFYELQLLDTTLLYGQGFFVFMIFGFDNEIIFEPVLFKLKSICRLIRPFKLVPESELPAETVNICEKFEKQYKDMCASSLEKNTRFHYSFYQRVFSGSSMVDWFISHHLVKTRAQGKRLGRKLVEGRVIHHVTFKRDFYDGYHLYKFY